jgi:hypothetical protein
MSTTEDTSSQFCYIPVSRLTNAVTSIESETTSGINIRSLDPVYDEVGLNPP